MKTTNLYIKTTILLVTFLFSLAFIGDSADAKVCVNMAGQWNGTSTIDGTDCGDAVYTVNYTGNITQDNDCNISHPVGTKTYTGYVEGNNVFWSGSFPDEGGITKIDSVAITVSGDGNSINGVEYWTWYFGGVAVCSGTTSINANQAGAASDPVPDIKANGSDNSITVSEGAPVAITISLDPGSQVAQNADWWVLESAPDGWYYYDVIGGFWSFLPGLSVTYQGPLFNLASFGVLNTSELPVGTYTFYFGVDMTMNGLVDVPLFYDYVGVSVQIDLTGTWKGTWHSRVYGINGDFKTTVVQQGSTLSGLISVPDIGIYNADLKGTGTGNNVVFGDFAGKITFTGTLSGNSTLSGTYVYPSQSDNGTWQAAKQN